MSDLGPAGADRMAPTLRSVDASEGLKLPNGCDTLLVDVSDIHPRRRGYAAKLAAVAMQAELPTVQIGVRVRYKVWRSNKDKRLHLLCAEGAEAFETLPAAVRNMGP